MHADQDISFLHESDAARQACAELCDCHIHLRPNASRSAAMAWSSKTDMHAGKS